MTFEAFTLGGVELFMQDVGEEGGRSRKEGTLRARGGVVEKGDSFAKGDIPGMWFVVKRTVRTQPGAMSELHRENQVNTEGKGILRAKCA
jgi:hypothetical protein